MRVIIAGSHGLIGSALVRHLHEGGHDVVRLVRHEVRGADEIAWDPDAGRLDAADLAGADAVVNLGGAGVGDRRWTAAYRRTVLQSRTRPTSLLARTLAEVDGGPRVLLQGSAVGFYGDRGEEVLTEASPGGTGFLADVVRAWEDSTGAAVDAGVRVAHLRTGIVVSRSGGSFGRLLPLLRLGVGGPLGSGRNYWPWITLVDQVRAIEHLLTAEVAGAVNVVGPEPAPQGEVVRAIARELHRPAVLAVPRFALRIAVGEFADDILASQRVLPEVLTASGFTFTHADLAAAARWVTGRSG
ncbi:epimerase [Actinotalea ferrariae CF5-4]|uniref:Epimerase n=1 Tax=Actinotalea ferrariae CF5-4 TaxID=948458 RepID=A0A021W092_9CELL|nr:TIGR01777 family oxidoreductase [Actinotalea ferrariae]EYR64757.1 epimerase [Actinotalea ferrariae CF5-4]